MSNITFNITDDNDEYWEELEAEIARFPEKDPEFCRMVDAGFETAFKKMLASRDEANRKTEPLVTQLQVAIPRPGINDPISCSGVPKPRLHVSRLDRMKTWVALSSPRLTGACAASSQEEAPQEPKLLQFSQMGKQYWFEQIQLNGQYQIVLCGTETPFNALAIKFAQDLVRTKWENEKLIVLLSPADLSTYIGLHKEDPSQWPLPVIQYTIAG